MISSLLFWSYVLQRSVCGSPEGFELEVGAAALSAGLLFGAFAFIGAAPAFYQEWSTYRRALLAPLGTVNTDWFVEGTIRCRNRQTHPPAVSFRAHVRRILRTVRADIGACAGLSALALFLRRPACSGSLLTAITVAAWVAIAAGRPFSATKVVPRYFLAALLLCILLAAAGAERVTAPDFRPRSIGFLVVAVCLATLYMTASFVTDSGSSLRRRSRSS